jgi:hypothetical protein
MPDCRHYLETLQRLVPTLRGQRVRALPGEASTRKFFRVQHGRSTAVAVVYPEKNTAEIRRLADLTILYLSHGINVPAIQAIYADQVLLVEDAGDMLLQRHFRRAGRSERRHVLRQLAVVLIALQRIPLAHLRTTLDQERMIGEMEFFLNHFAAQGALAATFRRQLAEELRHLVLSLPAPGVFAHRDFHSRNMLLQQGKIYLVDIQDSLVSPPGYDLASLVYDSYLDLGALRTELYEELARNGLAVAAPLLHRVALQRNIKALGTFGNQIHNRKNLRYARYVPRTVRHINAHLRFLGPAEFPLLSEFFHNLRWPGGVL